MKITINEPCHENWDAMTPNTQGAFCKSCAKDVVDFSKMGLNEIKSFFSKPHSNKICGRFEEKQLQELTFDDFFSRFTYWNFTKKFAAIFFMAFGFWIFSNSSAIAQSDSHMMKGEVMYVPDKTPKKDTVKKQPVKDDETRHIKGKIARNINYEPETIRQETFVKGDTTVEKRVVKNDCVRTENMVMGMIAIRPQPKKNAEPIKSDTIKKQEPPITNTLEQLNKSVTDKKTEITKNETVLKIDSITEVTNTNNQIIIYPNPTVGNFIIETKKETKQIVYIYDENGKIVLTQTIYGTNIIDANGLKSGIYNIIIIDTITNGLTKKRIVVAK